MQAMYRMLINLIFLTAGVLSASFGLLSFLIPNQFIDGGVTGLSMLLSGIFGWNLPLLLVIINVPFVVIGFIQIGRMFAFLSGLAITGLALTVHFLDFPEMTHDKLLAAIFGGVFLGGGIGLSIRGSGVLDGTEIMALFVHRKFGLKVGEVILGFNLVLFSVSAYFLGVEVAMYSILTYFAASKAIDFIIHGIEEYHGVMIISQIPDAIKAMILSKMGRGVTVFKGAGGYNSEEREVLYCVITRPEVTRLRRIVKEQDPNAFVIFQSLNEVLGGTVKKRSFHH